MTAARRDRTRTTALLVAFGLAFAGFVPAIAAAPASAAPATAAPAAAAAGMHAGSSKAKRPVLTVVPGDRRLSLSWTKVSGAKRYIVEWSTSKKFTKKKTKRVTTTSQTRTITKIPVRKDYWVRVRAVTSKGTVTSKAVKKRADTRSVGRVQIKVKAAGLNKVKVTWGTLPRGTSVTLHASWDNLTLSSTSKRWAVTGIRPTAKSTVLTVPTKFRKYIGAATGNHVYVRASYYNGKRIATSQTAHTRAGTAAPVGKTADAVTFATYNIGSIAATAKSPAHLRWEKRRNAVLASLKRADADVIALQEATTARSSQGERQYREVAAGLGRGYALAYSDETVGTAPGAQTKGDHIVVRSSRIKVLRSGVQSLRAILAPGDRIDKDRFFGWARLQDRRTGETFVVASIHLQSNARASSSHRVAAISAINTFVSARATGDPVVLLGDFNADVVRDTNGATTTLIKAGFVDAASARRVEGHRWATTNNQTAASKGDGGYPAKPFRYAYSPTRIDYIFVKGGSVHSHANQVVLTSAGTFSTAFRGSDHNLQRAQITFGG